MSIPAVFAALADFVQHIDMNLYDYEPHLELDRVTKVAGLHLMAKDAMIPIYWPRTRTEGEWLVDQYAERWDYRDEPEDTNNFVAAWALWHTEYAPGSNSTRVWLCGPEVSDCAAVFYAAARNFKQDSAFNIGELSDAISFCGKGGDEAPNNYLCPVCMKPIEWGEEIYLYLGESEQ